MGVWGGEENDCVVSSNTVCLVVGTAIQRLCHKSTQNVLSSQQVKLKMLVEYSAKLSASGGKVALEFHPQVINILLMPKEDILSS